MPHVSVIVPNYNYSRYLRQRIDSILCQTYQDFELILLDDKSTDDSVSVLSTYSENPHVSHIVVNEKNSGGVFFQWEKGINLAKGDYIWIAEADDWAEPTFLEKCVGVLDGNKETVLCQTGSQLIDSNNNKIKATWDRFDNYDGKLLSFKGSTYTRKFLRYSNFLYNASGIVFRKSAVGEFPQDVKYFKSTGDWLFWILLAQKGGVIIIKERLNYFRRHAGSASAGVNVCEAISIFKALVGMHIFKLGLCHSTYLMEGVLQRHIKHIQDEPLKQSLSQRLEEVTHSNTKLPYHYSQFCKLLNRFLPVCLFSPTRKY